VTNFKSVILFSYSKNKQMKKTIALLSSLLIFAGVKAQTPTIKKETVKPVVQQPGVTTDQSKEIKIGTTIKQTDKVVKLDKTINSAHIKKTSVEIPFKEAVAKPHKG
jgi:uncharacterized lipoprotein YajG